MADNDMSVSHNIGEEQSYNNIELPPSIEIKESSVNSGSPGAFSKILIAEDTRFGPYKGEIISPDQKPFLDYRYAWEVFEKNSNVLKYTISASDPQVSNWMRNVNCARFYEEQNILSVQEGYSIYYVAMKDIKPGEELLTWFDPKLLRRTQRRLSKTERRPVGYFMELVSTSNEKKFVPEIIQTKRARKKKVLSDMISLDEEGPLAARRNLKKMLREQTALLSQTSPEAFEPGSNLVPSHQSPPIKAESTRKRGRKPKYSHQNSLLNPQVQCKNLTQASISDTKDTVLPECELKMKKDSPPKLPQKLLSSGANSAGPLQAITELSFFKDNDQNEENLEGRKKRKIRKNLVGMKRRNPSRRRGRKAKLVDSSDVDLSMKIKMATWSVKPVVIRKSPDGSVTVDDYDESYTMKGVDLRSQCDDLCQCLNKQHSMRRDAISESSFMQEFQGTVVIRFSLLPEHRICSKDGEIVYKCDICDGAYKHAFSLKRHYLTVHINHRYLSYDDICNCQIETVHTGIKLQEDNTTGKLGDLNCSSGSIPFVANNKETNYQDVPSSKSNNTHNSSGASSTSNSTNCAEPISELKALNSDEKLLLCDEKSVSEEHQDLNSVHVPSLRSLVQKALDKRKTNGGKKLVSGHRRERSTIPRLECDEALCSELLQPTASEIYSSLPVVSKVSSTISVSKNSILVTNPVCSSDKKCPEESENKVEVLLEAKKKSSRCESNSGFSTEENNIEMACPNSPPTNGHKFECHSQLDDDGKLKNKENAITKGSRKTEVEKDKGSVISSQFKITQVAPISSASLKTTVASNELMNEQTTKLSQGGILKTTKADCTNLPVLAVPASKTNNQSQQPVIFVTNIVFPIVSPNQNPLSATLPSSSAGSSSLCPPKPSSSGVPQNSAQPGVPVVLISSIQGGLNVQNSSSLPLLQSSGALKTIQTLQNSLSFSNASTYLSSSDMSTNNAPAGRSVSVFPVSLCQLTLPSSIISSSSLSTQSSRQVGAHTVCSVSSSTTCTKLVEKDSNAPCAAVQPEERPIDLYRCHMCVQVFKTVVQLKHHIKNDPHRFKGGIKQYGCLQCSMRFSNKNNLIRHNLMNHQEEKDLKHRCLTCGKAFSTETYLKMHARFHSGKNFPCKYGCVDLIFANAASLVKHLREAHEGLNRKEFLKNAKAERTRRKKLNRLFGLSDEDISKLRKDDTALSKRDNLVQDKDGVSLGTTGGQVPYSIDQPGIGFQAKRGRPKGSRNGAKLARLEQEKINTEKAEVGKCEGEASLAGASTEPSSEVVVEAKRVTRFTCKLCQKGFSTHMGLLRHRSGRHGAHQSVQEYLYQMSKDKTDEIPSDPICFKIEDSPPMSPKSFQDFVKKRGAENMNNYIDGGPESMNMWRRQIPFEYLYDNFMSDQGPFNPIVTPEWTHHNFPPCFKFSENCTVFYEKSSSDINAKDCADFHSSPMVDGLGSTVKIKSELEHPGYEHTHSAVGTLISPIEKGSNEFVEVNHICRDVMDSILSRIDFIKKELEDCDSVSCPETDCFDLDKHDTKFGTPSEESLSMVYIERDNEEDFHEYKYSTFTDEQDDKPVLCPNYSDASRETGNAMSGQESCCSLKEEPDEDELQEWKPIIKTEPSLEEHKDVNCDSSVCTGMERCDMKELEDGVSIKMEVEDQLESCESVSTGADSEDTPSREEATPALLSMDSGISSLAASTSASLDCSDAPYLSSHKFASTQYSTVGNSEKTTEIDGSILENTGQMAELKNKSSIWMSHMHTEDFKELKMADKFSILASKFIQALNLELPTFMVQAKSCHAGSRFLKALNLSNINKDESFLNSEKLSIHDIKALIQTHPRERRTHSFSSLSIMSPSKRTLNVNASDLSRHDHRRYSIWSRVSPHKIIRQEVETFCCPVMESVKKQEFMKQKDKFEMEKKAREKAASYTQKPVQRKAAAFTNALGLMSREEFELSPHAQLQHVHSINPPEIWENYNRIWFGKRGTITVVCSMCHRHFSCHDLCLRHQLKKHPHIEPSSLAMERDNFVEDMFYYYPTPYGILAKSQLIPDNLPPPEVYVCTRCSFPFKTLSRLHAHMVACDPSKDEISAGPGQQKPLYMKKKSRPTMDRALNHQPSPAQLKPGRPFKARALAPSRKPDMEEIRNGYVHKVPTSGSQLPNNPCSVPSASVPRRTSNFPSGFAFLSGKKRKNYEMMYNPKKHVRRRELYQVLEQQQCHGCNLKFKSLPMLERHVKKCSGRAKLQNQKPLLSGIMPDDAAVRKQHTCRYCNKRFTYIKGVDLHYKRVCAIRKVKEEENTLSTEDLAHEDELRRIIEHMKWSKTLNKDSSDIIQGHVRVEEDGSLTRVVKKRGWPRGLKKRVKKKGFKWTTLKRHRPDGEMSPTSMESNSHGHRSSNDVVEATESSSSSQSINKESPNQTQDICQGSMKAEPLDDSLVLKRSKRVTRGAKKGKPKPVRPEGYVERRGRPRKLVTSVVKEDKVKRSRGRPSLKKLLEQKVDTSSSSVSEQIPIPNATKPPSRKRGRPKKFDPSELESSYKKKKKTDPGYVPSRKDCGKREDHVEDKKLSLEKKNFKNDSSLAASRQRRKKTPSTIMKPDHSSSENKKIVQKGQDKDLNLLSPKDDKKIRSSTPVRLVGKKALDRKCDEVRAKKSRNVATVNNSGKHSSQLLMHLTKKSDKAVPMNRKDSSTPSNGGTATVISSTPSNDGTTTVHSSASSNGGTATVCSSASSNDGITTVHSSASSNGGTATVCSSTLSNSGTTVHSSASSNGGTATVYSSTLGNSGTTTVHSSASSNDGTTTVYSSASSNSGTTTVYSSTLGNSGTTTVHSSASSNGGTATVYSSTLGNSGTTTVHSSASSNDGTTTVHSSASSNGGTATVHSSTLGNSGTTVHSSASSNGGTATVYSSTLGNSGTTTVRTKRKVFDALDPRYPKKHKILHFGPTGMPVSNKSKTNVNIGASALEDKIIPSTKGKAGGQEASKSPTAISPRSRISKLCVPTTSNIVKKPPVSVRVVTLSPNGNNLLTFEDAGCLPMTSSPIVSTLSPVTSAVTLSTTLGALRSIQTAQDAASTPQKVTSQQVILKSEIGQGQLTTLQVSGSLSVSSPGNLLNNSSGASTAYTTALSETSPKQTHITVENRAAERRKPADGLNCDKGENPVTNNTKVANPSNIRPSPVIAPPVVRMMSPPSLTMTTRTPFVAVSVPSTLGKQESVASVLESNLSSHLPRMASPGKLVRGTIIPSIIPGGIVPAGARVVRVGNMLNNSSLKGPQPLRVVSNPSLQNITPSVVSTTRLFPAVITQRPCGIQGSRILSPGVPVSTSQRLQVTKTTLHRAGVPQQRPIGTIVSMARQPSIIRMANPRLPHIQNQGMGSRVRAPTAMTPRLTADEIVSQQQSTGTAAAPSTLGSNIIISVDGIQGTATNGGGKGNPAGPLPQTYPSPTPPSAISTKQIVFSLEDGTTGMLDPDSLVQFLSLAPPLSRGGLDTIHTPTGGCAQPVTEAVNPEHLMVNMAQIQPQHSDTEVTWPQNGSVDLTELSESSDLEK